MKQHAWLMSVIGVLVLILAASAVWAQPGMGRGGGQGRGAGPGDPTQRLYNPHTVETLNGEVTQVDTSTRGQGGQQGLRIILKTDKESIPVHLGPAWYAEKQGVTFAAGDKVEVTGSRVTYAGKPTIIAAEIKKGGQVLKLRNFAGVPAWAGQGRPNR